MPYVFRGRWRRGGVLGVAAAAAMMSACSVELNDLAFRVDDRLRFVAPAERALVEEPVTVRWTIHDFSVITSGGPDRRSGYFGVFVDRAPVKPGQTLDAVGEDDPTCTVDPQCPDEEYLAARGVYTTTESQLVLDRVPPLTDSAEEIHLHRVTVVLLDTVGRRIGESAWETVFRLKAKAVL